MAADFKHIEEFFAGNFHKSLGNNFRSSFFGRPSNLALVQPNRDFSGYREGIKREASCFFFPKKTFSNEQVFRGGRDAKCEGVTTKNYKKCRQSVAGVSILRYFSRTLLIIYSHFYKNLGPFYKKLNCETMVTDHRPERTTMHLRTTYKALKRHLVSLHIIEFNSFSM